jgi:hypothetical protein
VFAEIFGRPCGSAYHQHRHDGRRDQREHAECESQCQG